MGIDIFLSFSRVLINNFAPRIVRDQNFNPWSSIRSQIFLGVADENLFCSVKINWNLIVYLWTGQFACSILDIIIIIKRSALHLQ